MILHAGSRAELVGKLERNPLFTQVVTIKPEDFPLGVFCRSTQVLGNEVEFRVPCEAGESVEPGEFSIELTSSSTLAGRDQEQVPYTIPSVSARLVVPVPSEPDQAAEVRASRSVNSERSADHLGRNFARGPTIVLMSTPLSLFTS